MTKLTDKHKSILLLIHRSIKPDSDGWASCSSVCWPLMSQVPSELIEADPAEAGCGRVRFTPTGEIVMRYLI